MTKDTYYDYFQSVKDRILDLNLSTVDNLRGVNESLISELECQLNVKFPLSFNIFLHFFGNKRIEMLPELTMTISDIIEAQRKNAEILNFFTKEDFIIDSDGMKIVNGEVTYIKYVDGHYEEEEKVALKDLFDIDKIIFIYSVFTTTLIDSRQENPIIHFLNTDKSFTSSRLRLTDYLRDIIFNAIKLKLEDRDFSHYNKENNTLMYEMGKRISQINISEIDWAKEYLKLFKTTGIKPYEVLKFREKFYFLNKIKEEQNNNILTIDEFEWAFIDYLKEQGYEF